MGLSPRQVDELSLWEFQAMLGGFIQANSTTPTTPPLTPEDVDRLGAVVKAARAR